MSSFTSSPKEARRSCASDLEREITAAVPEVTSVQTHLEPLTETGTGRSVDRDEGGIAEIVRATTGRPPRELRFLDTDEGLVAFLTLGLDPDTSLADAHRRASEVEERIRRERPEIADVIVHTE